MFYLIEHNRSTKKTTWNQYTHYEEVKVASLQKEQDFFAKNQHEMEVVVFEANSLDDLKRTHSRYFVSQKGEDNNVSGALMAVGAVGLVGLAIYLLNEK